MRGVALEGKINDLKYVFERTIETIVDTIEWLEQDNDALQNEVDCLQKQIRDLKNKEL